MTRAQRVVVLGQGYVGLPVALRAVDAGFDVVGFDVDPERVLAAGSGTLVHRGRDGRGRRAGPLVREVPSDHEQCRPGEIRHRRRVCADPAPRGRARPEIHRVGRRPARRSSPCRLHRHPRVDDVPRYDGGDPDPTSRIRLGLRAGVDFSVGYSPERIDPSDPRWNLRNTPKIVSGIDEASLKAVDEFFSQLVDSTVRTPGVKEAELAKLLENTFRHVNIALVNELAMYANELNIDVWAVIDAAATKPFGFMPFTPGPRCWWSLSPDRPVLPVVAGASVPRAGVSIRRTGQRRQ